MDIKKVSGEKRGAVLIVTFMVIAILVIISIGMFLRMISESRTAERYKDAAGAFYAAEAAIDSAITQLPSNLSPATGVSLQDPNGNVIGKYSFTIASIIAGEKWEIVGTGYAVGKVGETRAQKTIKAVVSKKDLGDFFWDNAILSAGNVTFKGTAYSVTGDVRFAGSISGEDQIPAEDVIHDTGVAPLPLLDFQYLLNKAASQGHVYTGYDSSMPTTFWFDQSDPDPTKWIPNVVYIQGDLRLSGSKDKVGGFLIVGGDVIQNVDVTGSATVDGCIYTRGYFQNKGGGNQLNINGGIWAGTNCNLTGNVTVTYNKTYMDAIRNNIDPTTEIQLISWREE